jgi:hypothetical protein
MPNCISKDIACASRGDRPKALLTATAHTGPQAVPVTPLTTLHPLAGVRGLDRPGPPKTQEPGRQDQEILKKPQNFDGDRGARSLAVSPRESRSCCLKNSTGPFSEVILKINYRHERRLISVMAGSGFGEHRQIQMRAQIHDVPRGEIVGEHQGRHFFRRQAYVNGGARGAFNLLELHHG